MICTKCGTENPGNNRFCGNCGALIGEELSIKEVVEKKDLLHSEVVIDTKPKTEPAHSKQLVSPGIIQGTDGILRWAYEMNMWKNPTLIITIWKVFLLAASAPALLVFFLSLGEGDGFGTAFFAFAEVLGIVAVILTGLMLLAYTSVALMNGGKYCVIFEMDDKSVKHIQMQKQFKKSQVLSMITILAGVITGNVQATAAGMLAGSKQSSLSSFAKVKTIVTYEKRHVIYVNENFSRNQVYTDPADFAFVSEHIISRCKKAKVTNK